MDDDVLQLVREERLLEAAQLCSARGDAAGASALFERACDWRNAATEALRADDAVRGLELALRAGDEAIAHAAIAWLVGPGSAGRTEPAALERAAAHLAHRGHDAWAARVLEGAQRHLDAARAWERAGDLTRAATLFERAGEPAQAARVLEATLRRDPGGPAAASASVALGALLLRFGKDEAALRSLQRVPSRAPERRGALTLAIEAMRRLGLASAASAAEAELAALGGPIEASLDAEVSNAASNAPRGPGSTALLYGRYLPTRQIASSARARVLEASDQARGERVAIKVYARAEAGDHALSPGRAAFARLESDVRALRMLDHPAIVPVRAFYPSDPAVVMAWMEGGTLEQMLERGPLAPARAAEIACAILSALGDAHRLGILHRDVKATNVLFDGAGSARLSDFGSAHSADASATVTAGDIAALSTVSPEQRDGREITARSDVFAVGVLLEAMLTGRLPGALPPPGLPSATHPSLDARHDRLVIGMTAPDPNLRPADAFQARDMVLALPWPGPASHTGEPPGATRERTSDRAGKDRLEPRPDGGLLDTWTGRAIEQLALSTTVLERAQLFARADHDALQPVLRVDREGGTLWLAHCSPSMDRPLTPAERDRIDAALSALRAAGGDTGSADTTLGGLVGLVGQGSDGKVMVRFDHRPTPP